MIDEANAALREKGYTQAQLYVEAAPKAGRALLKGTKILSPLADTPETIHDVVQRLVPPAEDLGRRQLTPFELREQLAG